MLVIPAVDLRAGKCVQLVGGSYENESLRLDNPAEVARGWTQQGFQRLHVVDLDAALEWGRKLARATTLPIEVRPFADVR